MVIQIEGDTAWLGGSLGGTEMVAGEVLNYGSICADG